MSDEPAEEPKDPVEKAQYLINRRSLIEKSISDAKQDLEKWELQLSRVESAEALLKQLAEI